MGGVVGFVMAQSVDLLPEIIGVIMGGSIACGSSAMSTKNNTAATNQCSGLRIAEPILIIIGLDGGFKLIRVSISTASGLG